MKFFFLSKLFGIFHIYNDYAVVMEKISIDAYNNNRASNLFHFIRDVVPADKKEIYKVYITLHYCYYMLVFEDFITCINFYSQLYEFDLFALKKPLFAFYKLNFTYWRYHIIFYHFLYVYE